MSVCLPTTHRTPAGLQQRGSCQHGGLCSTGRERPTLPTRERALVTLRIRHRTTYLYNEPVTLGPHRLMLRPRESRDLRLLSMELAVEPRAVITWAQDVSGNAVATANFQVMSDRLIIDSAIVLALDAPSWPVFDVAASAIQ